MRIGTLICIEESKKSTTKHKVTWMEVINKDMEKLGGKKK